MSTFREQHPWATRLYAPWAWGVFYPAFALLTGCLAILAIAIGLVSHRAGFWSGTAWGWLLCRLNFTPVRVVGRANAAPGQAYVLLANHRSYFDILAFYGHWPRQFRWVMKAELRRTPFLGWSTAVLGNLFIDRHDRARAMAQLRRARPLLDQGISVLVFPEGTRSPTGRMLPLRKGGIVLAVDAGLPILPVSISGTRAILPPDTLALLPGRVTITIHPPIPTTGVGPSDIDALADRVRDAIVSGLQPDEI